MNRYFHSSLRTCCVKMEKEFEDLFTHFHRICNSKQIEMRKVLSPLRNYLWKQQLKKFAKIFFLILAICGAIAYIDCLNWYFCALGRIAMINLLPLWDWTYLANARCLIPKAKGQSKIYDGIKALDEKDCRACQHFGNYFKHN